jgi:opacity protein-like surface antigen
MKNCLAALIFLFFLLNDVQGQNFYVKPYARYHQSVAKRYAPQYFTLALPTSWWQNAARNDVSSQILKFSLADGMKYGVSLGYQFDNIIGFETGIDYFRTNKKVLADIASFAPTGMTEWTYQAVQASPKLTFRKTNKRSSLAGKAGIIIGVAWLENTVSYNSYFLGYEMDKNISLGYTFGLEYNFNFSSYLSLAIEGGLEHSSYTPAKANLSAMDNVNQSSPRSQTKSVKEIRYVNQLKDIPGIYDSYGQWHNADDNSPQVRMKDALHLTSVYIGVGIKYNFNKK